MIDVKKILYTEYRGDAPKGAHLKFMMLPIALYILAVTVAIISYPGYTPLENQISDMGGFTSNLVTWWFFDASIIIVGILMIPHFLYLYRLLIPTTRLLTQLAMLSGMVGCIGFSFVGIFPEEVLPPHEWAANIAFGGMGIAAFLTFFILLKRIRGKASWPSWKTFILLYGPLTVSIILIIVMPHLNPVPGIDSRWFTWPPWQWASMFSLMYWLIMMALIVPDRPINSIPTPS